MDRCLGKVSEELRDRRGRQMERGLRKRDSSQQVQTRKTAEGLSRKCLCL